MNILALDTSSKNATAAVVSEQTLLGEFTVCNPNTHSQILLPMVDQMLKNAGLCISDIDVFCTAIGPGSFTGLRIGMATAKAFALAAGKPIIGVSSLLALAANVAFTDKVVCPMLDARRGDVYNALYQNGRIIAKERALSVSDLLLELKGRDTIFLGDGALAFQTEILEKMGEHAQFAPPGFLMARASSLADIALKRAKAGAFDNPDTLAPIYLRVSQAEREYESKHAK